jgi:hypothetical protein
MWILKNFTWQNNSPHNKKPTDSSLGHETEKNKARECPATTKTTSSC